MKAKIVNILQDRHEGSPTKHKVTDDKIQELQRKQMIAFYRKTCNKTISLDYAAGIVDKFLNPS